MGRKEPPENPMSKPGIEIDIPGFGRCLIKKVVSDYTGTHSCGGELVEGVKDRLIRLAESVDIVILTSDSFGTAEKQLSGIPLQLRKLQYEKLREGEPDDEQKERIVKEYDPKHVAALGNGNNDRLMLKLVKEAGGLAIAVDNSEGCAIDALVNANLFIVGSANAIDLLLEPTRCKATLRF
jgi:soluble P-type ATPase